MNIDYELYRIFYIVAKNGNITRSSKELLISEPAVSKSIKNLEGYLGAPLFTRTKKGVNLTTEGITLYEYISKGIEYFKSGEAKFNELINLESGTIRIGINTTLTKEFLMPYLETFHKLYPNINIEIRTNLTSELKSMLKDGLIDMHILNLTNEETKNDFNIIKCKTITDCFVSNKPIKEKISIKELNNYPLILQDKNSNTRKFLDDFANKYEITLKPKIEIGSYYLVSEFSRIGLGIGYVTKDYIKNNLDNKELFIVPIKEKIPSREIGILLNKNTTPNFSTKELIKIITQNTTN
ncbi:transcriptional regulator LysR family [Clostridium sp. CAG:628]|nr:transcriptional regulator LysR family [Clostridium sp. CAG:628]